MSLVSANGLRASSLSPVCEVCELLQVFTGTVFFFFFKIPNVSFILMFLFFHNVHVSPLH